MATETTTTAIDESVPVDPERVPYPGTEDGRRVAWEVLPTKAHLTTDDIDAPGTGPAGWGIYLADDPEAGYFAWFSSESSANALVTEHNEAVEAFEEVERLQGELMQAESDDDELRAEVRRLGLRLTHAGIESEAGSWSKHEMPRLHKLLGEEG